MSDKNDIIKQNWIEILTHIESPNTGNIVINVSQIVTPVHTALQIPIPIFVHGDSRNGEKLG